MGGRPRPGFKHFKTPSKNPEAECRPNWRVLKAFHAAVELAPVILPKLIEVLMMRLLMAIPAALLGCLGFLWGKQLYNRLKAGYTHVAATHQNGQPMNMSIQLPQATS